MHKIGEMFETFLGRHQKPGIAIGEVLIAVKLVKPKYGRKWEKRERRKWEEKTKRQTGSGGTAENRSKIEATNAQIKAKMSLNKNPG